MSWRALLKGDPVPWLLERSDPAVRAQTLRSLLDKGPRDPELRDAQQRAMNTPPISTIRWPGANLWGPKYEATHWTNLLLVEYGVDPGDPRVRRAARYVLEELSRPGRGGMDWVFNKDHGASCLIGSVVRYVAMAGYGNDERLEPLVQRLVRDSKNFDAACWINGEQPCAWGYARLIWGLASSHIRSSAAAIRRTRCRAISGGSSRSHSFTKPTSCSSSARSMRPGPSTTTARSRRSAGSSRDRTNAGVGAAGRRTRLACPREWTRASG